MAIKPLVQLGNPILVGDNKQISDVTSVRFSQLREDLVDTMRDADLVGIAAPQIGENYQVFLTEPRETKFRSKHQSDILRTFVHPNIVNCSSEQVEMYEGCGSVEKIGCFGPVTRPKEVQVEAFDEHGKKFRLVTDGLLARIIQHELDHLHGITFLEKVTDRKKLLSYDEYITFKNNNNAQVQELSRITKIQFEYV